MNSKAAEAFMYGTLGEDFLESLAKSDLWKPGTKSVSDIEDMRVGLKIVPRTVMALLIRELSGMENGQNRRVPLHVAPNSFLNATKHERDQFSGDIESGGKKLTEFKFRSIPGIGLVIMSTFELYSVEELAVPAEPVSEDLDQKVQKLIDERLALHDLIGRVVDNKLAHKDAVHTIVLARLTDELAKEKAIVAAYDKGPEEVPSRLPEPLVVPMKRFPVKEFLQKRQSKKEFTVQMAKGETASCEDCGHVIFGNGLFSGCICLGENFGSKVFLKKNAAGVQLKFGREWNEETLEMLLETLRKRRG
jgi:hypothetical protein